MSINSRMSKYDLFRVVLEYDKYGKLKGERLDLVATIDINISFRNIAENTGGGGGNALPVDVKEITHIALTKYKAFNQAYKYKLKNDTRTFEVKTINLDPRLITLYLKELIAYE